MGLLTRLIQLLTGRRPPEALLRSFHRYEQELQDNCFRLASESGKPRGLRWVGCDWLDTFAIVRDPASGLITLFRGANLSFEAVEGGDMEDVAAVSTIREAVGVFHQQDGRWGTGGRVLFNVTAPQAAETVAAGQDVLLVRSPESAHQN
ncbi:MAG: hypothetical protein Fues2KO_26890 [Fuerstiella sp.]